MSKWIDVKLGEIVSLGKGIIQTGPFGSQLHASDYVNEGVPCIMPANLKDNRINLEGIARISTEDASRLSKHVVQEDDIVYSRRGDITQKALITKNEVGFFCGTGCLLIRPGFKINAKFLLYNLGKAETISWLKNNSVGITMPNLNTKILSEIPLSLPSENDQGSIATILGIIDAKMDLNNKIKIELEAMIKTLYKYWFVQFDFPNEEKKPYKSSGGKMVYNEVLKREIPKGWEVKKFGDVFHVIRGTIITKETTTEGTYKVVAAGLKYSYLTGSFNRERYTITVSGSGANAGFVNFWTERIFASDCTTVRGSNEVETFLALYFLKLNQNYIFSQAKGSAQPHVYPSDIEGLKYIEPDKKLKLKFGNILSPIYERISNILKQNEELTQLRDWLLPMLMNGQVTVDDAEYVINKEFGTVARSHIS